MKEFTLSNIDTSFSCYNRFAALYDDLSFTNEISVKTENPGILSVLQRNNSYVMNELLSRPDLPAMTVFMNSERLEAPVTVLEESVDAVRRRNFRDVRFCHAANIA